MRNVEGIMASGGDLGWARSPSLLLSVRLVPTVVDAVLLVHQGHCCVIASPDWGSPQFWFFHSSCEGEIWPCFLRLQPGKSGSRGCLGPLPPPCSCHCGHEGAPEALHPQEGKGRPLCPWTITHAFLGSSHYSLFLASPVAWGTTIDWMLVYPSNSHVESLTPMWWYLEVGRWEVIRVWWGHEGGALMMGLVSL